MNIAIILLALSTIINACHINYVYKELRKIIDNEHKYLIDIIYKGDDRVKYNMGIELQYVINNIKSGKLKKETNKKKQD